MSNAKEKFKSMYFEAVNNISYQRDFLEDNAIVWAFNQINKKCVYVRESKIEQYAPECCIEDGVSTRNVHPQDMEGDFCQFCGGKVKKKTGHNHAEKYLFGD